jgi:HAD superfamily hydrolase (TIGR01509 family)
MTKRRDALSELLVERPTQGSRPLSPVAVIFDCDGTLVDSELLCNVVLAEALRALGIVETAAELLVRYRGGRMANILSDLAQRHALRLPANFEDDYRALVARAFERELTATAGAEALVRSLLGRAAVAVASSAPRAKVELALRVTGLLGLFEGNVFSSYEVGSWKPEPGIFLHVARELRVAPARCVVIEDSLLGADAAERAGMRCFLLDPHGAHRGSATHGASVIRSMAELAPLLA